MVHYSPGGHMVNGVVPFTPTCRQQYHHISVQICNWLISGCSSMDFSVLFILHSLPLSSSDFSGLSPSLRSCRSSKFTSSTCTPVTYIQSINTTPLLITCINTTVQQLHISNINWLQTKEQEEASTHKSALTTPALFLWLVALTYDLLTPK